MLIVERWVFKRLIVGCYSQIYSILWLWMVVRVLALAFRGKIAVTGDMVLTIVFGLSVMVRSKGLPICTKADLVFLHHWVTVLATISFCQILSCGMPSRVWADAVLGSISANVSFWGRCDSRLDQRFMCGRNNVFSRSQYRNSLFIPFLCDYRAVLWLERSSHVSFWDGDVTILKRETFSSPI